MESVWIRGRRFWRLYRLDHDGSRGHPARHLRRGVHLPGRRDVPAGTLLAGAAVTDIILIAVIVAFFAAAALLVRVIDGMIAGAAGQDGADEPEPGLEPGPGRPR